MIHQKIFRTFLPRTPRDYEQVGLWINKGLTNDQIFERMKKEIWRSEAITLAGRPYCALCLFPINPMACLECGMTLQSEG